MDVVAAFASVAQKEFACLLKQCRACSTTAGNSAADRCRRRRPSGGDPPEDADGDDGGGQSGGGGAVLSCAIHTVAVAPVWGSPPEGALPVDPASATPVWGRPPEGAASAVPALEMARAVASMHCLFLMFLLFF